MKTAALEVYKLLCMLVIISSCYLQLGSPFTCTGVAEEWFGESRSWVVVDRHSNTDF